MNKSDEDTVTIERSRVERVIEVLSVLSSGEFDAKEAQIETERRDDVFGQLEDVLNALSSELAGALSELRRTEETLRDKLETIDRQELTIQDLSTPIIEIWDNILTLPVVGIVDSQRSMEMTERLLQQVVETRSRCVIIDITGVDVVDTMTADHFIKMMKAARLLGCYCVVTGVSPEIAQTLVRIGISLTGVKTLRNLKDGLKDCFMFLRGLEADD